MARILVAEDDAALRRLYTIWLESAGHEVTEAADGREAIAHIERRVPEAAVLDIEMPFVDGLSVARYLHARDARASIVIVSGVDGVRAEALSAGAAEVLAKPCDRAALRAALDAAA
jgi:CheY-like chemotaxis protein